MKTKKLEENVYYQVYGDVPNCPIGFIHSDSAKNAEEALAVAKPLCAKRKIKARRVEKVVEKPVEYKLNGSNVNYLYYETDHVQLVGLGNNAAIVFHLGAGTPGNKKKGVGYCFDEKLFNEFFSKVLAMKEYFENKKKPNKQKVTKGK